MQISKFPALWSRFFDEVIPAYVKSRYSPNPKWKDKPFTKDDVDFFSKGVKELSHLLREDRKDSDTRKIVSYFEHGKSRSSYLLYFLALQAAKFFSLFERHSDALSKAMDLARKENRPLRVLDLGSGPGTASIALMIWIASRKNTVPVALTLVDQHGEVLNDAKGLIQAGVEKEMWPAADIRTIRSDCFQFRFEQDFDFAMLGHVLNESVMPREKIVAFLNQVRNHTQGAGVLIVDPADKISSQTLSHIRDHWIESHAGTEEEPGTDPIQVWGPCLHSAAGCPLKNSRDWCHFSWRAEIPGKWFREFSLRLGSQRDWVKLSYLWIASREIPPPTRAADIRLVISDPLEQPGKKPLILLCEPVQSRRHPLSILETKTLGRGSVIRVSPNELKS